MSRAAPRLVENHAPYSNMGATGTNSFSQSNLLKQLFKYREIQTKAKEWEIGDHNCAVVAVAYRQPATSHNVQVKPFFADSSGGDSSDTSTHAERRALDLAKTWAEGELRKNSVQIEKITVISELKACSVYHNSCSEFFSSGGATLGNPANTLVFNTARGHEFYYTNDHEEQLKADLASVIESEKVAKQKSILTSRKTEISNSKFDTKALNIEVNKALQGTLIMTFAEEEKKIFVNQIADDLRRSLDLETVNENILKLLNERGHGLFLKGKSGIEILKKIENCLIENRMNLSTAFDHENAPAWSATSVRHGSISNVNSSKEDSILGPGSSILFAYPSHVPPPLNLAPHRPGQKYTVDEIVEKMSFLNLSTEHQKELKNQISETVERVNDWNKSHKDGEPCGVFEQLEKFFYHKSIINNPLQTEAMKRILKGITSNDIILNPSRSKLGF